MSLAEGELFSPPGAEVDCLLPTKHLACSSSEISSTTVKTDFDPAGVVVVAEAPPAAELGLASATPARSFVDFRELLVADRAINASFSRCGKSYTYVLPAWCADVRFLDRAASWACFFDSYSPSSGSSIGDPISPLTRCARSTDRVTSPVIGFKYSRYALGCRYSASEEATIRRFSPLVKRSLNSTVSTRYFSSWRTNPESEERMDAS
mmetsp:Transcript_11549/g.28106  ORF Transcript_11549/g.28106 Transcript_11549/m.28106 type:complete len:208 (-) Transcript_11549:147-770(-)